MRAGRNLIVAVGVAAIVGALLASTTVVGFTTETTTTSPLVLAQPTTTRPSSAPTTSTTRPSTIPTPPTVSPIIVQPTTTRPRATTTTPPPTPPPTTSTPATSADSTTTTPLPLPDVSVRDIEVSQGTKDWHSLMPLVAGKSSTWVRVSTTHAGSGHGATVDGALLVEREGQYSEVLLADNAPIDVGPEGGVFEFLLEPHHSAAGEVSMTFTLFRPDGTPVDDSPRTTR